MRALLWKEWRDHRGLVLAGALGGPLLSFAIQRSMMGEARIEYVDEITARFVVPILVAVLLAALAADAFAREAEQGLEAGLARLAVSPARIFAVKLLYLATLGPCLLAWMTGAELLSRSVRGLDTQAFLRNLLGAENGLMLGGIVYVGAWVAAFGILVRRSLAAAAAGVVVVAGSIKLLMANWSLVLNLPALLHPVLLCVLPLLALILAGLLVYRPGSRGPLDGLRRCSMFAAVLLLIGLPVGLVAKSRYAASMQFEHSTGELIEMHPSPDGRLVLAVEQWTYETLSGGPGYEWGLAVYDVGTGRLQCEIDEGAPLYSGPWMAQSPWTIDNRLRLALPGPVAPHVVERNPRSGKDRQPLGDLRRVLDPGWAYVLPTESFARNNGAQVQGSRDPHASFFPGIVHWIDAEGRMMRTDKQVGSEIVLLTGLLATAPRQPLESPCGRFLAVHRGDWNTGSWHVLEARSGTPLCVPDPEWKNLWWTGGDEPYAVLHSSDRLQPRRRLFLESTGPREVMLEVDGRLKSAGSDHLLCQNSTSIMLMNKHGRVLNTVAIADGPGAKP